MQPFNIVAIAGSLRERSLNRAALRAAVPLAPASLSIELVSIADIPLYNGDLDVEDGPDPVRELKAKITAADGLLIATPEFNYGVPGVLKNAIDWVSRPAYRSPLAHKPVAMLGVTPSTIGTARAQGQLKQVLLGTLSEVFPHPEVGIGSSGSRFDADLTLTDERSREALRKLLEAYAAWLGRRRAGAA